MELRQLRYFATVAARGTYSAAAAELHVAQPALWQQVKQLERELGSPLFERTGRRVRLTRHGELLLGRCHGVLESVETLRRHAADLATGKTGLVAVACASPQIPKFLGVVLGRFREAHPDMTVEFHEHPPMPGDAVDELVTGTADLALGRPRPGLEGFPVAVNWVVALLPETPAEGGHRLDVRELENRPLLVTPPGAFSRTMLDRACSAAGFEPTIAYESPNPATLLELGRRGLGIPVLAEDALATVGSRLAGRELTGPSGPLAAEGSLLWRSQTLLTPAMEAFIEAAWATAAETMRPPTRASAGKLARPSGRGRSSKVRGPSRPASR